MIATRCGVCKIRVCEGCRRGSRPAWSDHVRRTPDARKNCSRGSTRWRSRTAPRPIRRSLPSPRRRRCAAACRAAIAKAFFSKTGTAGFGSRSCSRSAASTSTSSPSGLARRGFRSAPPRTFMRSSGCGRAASPRLRLVNDTRAPRHPGARPGDAEPRPAELPSAGERPDHRDLARRPLALYRSLRAPAADRRPRRHRTPFGRLSAPGRGVRASAPSCRRLPSPAARGHVVG